jgi:hypothetical protein
MVKKASRPINLVVSIKIWFTGRDMEILQGKGVTLGKVLFAPGSL